MWKNCRKRDQDFKALRLALKLSCSYVQYVQISYMPVSNRFPNTKFSPQIGKCKQIRYLSLTGTFFKTVKQHTLERLLSELPSLYCLSVTHNESCAIKAAKASKSLEVLCIYTNDIIYNHRNTANCWKDCGYMPAHLKLYYDFDDFDQHCVMHYALHNLTSSDHPAQLSIYSDSSPIAGNMVHKYPIIRLSLYPNVELLTCPTKSVCSSASHFSYLIVSRGNSSSQDLVSVSRGNSSSQDLVSATVNNLVSATVTMSLLPSSIESLSLKGTAKLSSADLTVISELCPKLVCLNIDCTDALLSLLGLADISSNCAGLAALNIRGIKNVENGLWEVLSRMRKLRYLSVSNPCVAPNLDERCVSLMNVSLARMNLFAILCDWLDNVPFQIEALLPACRMLQHLHIYRYRYGQGRLLDLTNVLPNLPSLTQLFIVGNFELRLPTHPDCYSSLKKLYIRSRAFDVSDDLARGLSQSPSLTYLYLYVRQSNPLLLELLGNFRRLCEFYVTVERGVDGQTHVLYKHGICGCCVDTTDFALNNERPEHLF